MIVFKQTRKLLFGCGVVVKENPSIKSRVTSCVYSVLIFLSNALYFTLSGLLIVMYLDEIEPFQIVYCILEMQWTLISILLLFVLYSVRRQIQRMVANLQTIVDTSKNLRTNLATIRETNRFCISGAKGAAKEFYEEAEKKVYAMSRWPKFLLQWSYIFVQISTCFAYMMLDLIRGEFDPRQYYLMTIM